jgi:hypothetical protein
MTVVNLLAGERFGGGDAVTAAAARAIKSAAAEEAADRRIADKAAKKAAFDTEYDVGATNDGCRGLHEDLTSCLQSM